MNQLNHSSDNCTIVFNARTMHNMLNPTQFTMYANNCPSTSNKIAENVIQDNKDDYIVYPNPTSKGFYIKGNYAQNTNLEVALIDMQGKLLLKQLCYYQGKDCYFDCNVLDGIYLVRIKNLINNEIQLVKLQILQH